MEDLPKRNNLTKIEKVALALAIASAALAFLFAFLPFTIRFIGQLTYLPAVILGIRSWRRTKFFGKSAPVLACAVLVLIGIAWAPSSERGRAMLVAVHLLAVLPIAALIVEKRCLRFCATTFVTASTITVLVSSKIMFSTLGLYTLQKFGTFIDDSGASLTNPNEMGASFGLALLFSIAIALGYFRESKSEKKPLDIKLIYYLITSIILTLATVLTGSRGAFVATFFSVLVLLMSKSNGLSKAKVIIVTFIVIAAPMIVISMITGISPIDRISDRFSNDSVGDIGGRVPIWERTFDVVANKSFYIIYGTGTAGSDKLVGSVVSGARKGKDGIYRRSTHSSYVEWFAYFGILGIFPAILLLFNVVRNAIKLDRISNSTDRVAILAFFLVFSCNGVVFRSPYWPMLGSMILALVSHSSLAGNSSPIFYTSSAKKERA